MGTGLEGSDLLRLHRAGIGKSTEHLFVYRYPDSDKMPIMDPDEFLQDVKKGSKKKRQLAFYLHVPFCTKICHYCHYFKQLPCNAKQLERYLRSVEKEISTYRKIVEAKVEVNSLLFGGGTPTVLEAGYLNELNLFLRAVFPMPRKTEATLESSPETLDLKKLAELRQNFNRLSIGVQDFDDTVLKACNRNHSKKQAMQAISDARNSGFDNINIDLIYGLPGQGIEGWKKTLKEIEGIQPESVTASDLRIHKGTKFFMQDRTMFASEQELVEMHSMFAEKMLSLGYEQIFPYQFARRGKEMVFLQNQWQNNEFIGFGPSSCSYFQEWDYNNVFPAAEYLEWVGASGLACAVGKKLGKGEQMIRAVALGLKNCGKGGVDKNCFKKRFGTTLEEEFACTIRSLEALGLVELDERFLRLSQRGILFYDSVSRKFFPRQKS